MKGSKIVIGETYHFVGSESPKRQHLAGQQFTVTDKKAVFRRFRKGTRKTYRYFNAEGIGARPEELEPMPERENGCSQCAIGEMIHTGDSPRANETAMTFTCNNCGHTETFP